jgi:hypothetical protein
MKGNSTTIMARSGSTPMSPTDAREIVDEPEGYDDDLYFQALLVLEAAGWE